MGSNYFLLSSRSPRTRLSFAPNKCMTRTQSLLLGAGRVPIYLQRNAVRWLVALVGRWEWQAPAWLPWVGRQSALGWRRATATRARTATLAAAVLAIAGASVWWFTRPTPHYVTYSVTPPGLTEYNDNGISSIKPMSIVFSESAAPLAQMQKAVTTGITMSPAVAGTWFWTSDKELQFTPKDDWPVDGAFSVQFCRKWLLRRRSRARELPIQVQEPAVLGTIAESQFYQDPVDPNLKKLVATVAFSHPVDTGAVRVARLARGRQGRGVSGPDAGQPALHRGVRQVQAGRLHPLGRAGHAARRHADDAEDRSAACARLAAATTRRSAAGGRHDPGPHQPALLRAPA